MLRFGLVVLAAGVMAGSLLSAPGVAARGDWVWSPGLCKSKLKHYGVELSDGRTFGIADAFCVGRGGLAHCQWASSSHLKRLYDRFFVVVRSYDGNIRVAELYTSGKDDYELEQIKLIGHEPSSASFNRRVAPLTASIARQEHEKGCAD